mgnify:CR=1 FL=1
MKNIKSYLIIFFLFNTISAQEIYEFKTDKDVKVIDFIRFNNISISDFFVLNPKFSNDRLNYNDADLEKIILLNEKVKICIKDDYDENDLIVHKIQKKQTIESISLMYNISKELINYYNPNINIKKNNILKIPKISENIALRNDFFSKIPVKPIDKLWKIAFDYGMNLELFKEINQGFSIEKYKELVVINNDHVKKKNSLSFENQFSFYLVKTKTHADSLFSNDMLNKESFFKLNPHLNSELLNFGDIIKIPISIKIYPKSNFDILGNTVDLKRQIKLGLILNFRSENFNDDNKTNYLSLLENDKMLNISLDYLFGSLMAVDSIAKYGYSIDFDVFDSSNNKDKLLNLFSKNDFSKYDFVIGPIKDDLFNYFTEISKANDTKIVKPLSQNHSKSSNVINTIPTDSILYNKVIEYVSTFESNTKKYIISDLKNINLSNKIKSSFPEAIQISSKRNKDGNDTKSLNRDELKLKFQNGRHIVFLESSSEAFISNVTSLLNSFLSKECKIILITTNKDKAYDGNNISNNFLTNLSFIYPSINKPINFQEKSKFIKKYNETYNYYPNRYSLRGFDIAYDLILRLVSGNIDDESMLEIETSYFENKFKYVVSEGGSLDNTSVYLLQYDNFDIIEIMKN